MLELIKSRRSIRKYKNTPVKEEDLNLILEAAMYAPTARNKQPWHFIIVNDRPALDRMMENHPNMSMLSTAPCAIIVCGDKTISEEGYCITDSAAATENILLAAKELGYGTCWCAVYPRADREEFISSIFGLPEEILPFSVIALGYPDEEKECPERFKPDRIHINKW